MWFISATGYDALSPSSHPLTCWNPSFQPTSSPRASFSCRQHVLHQITLLCVPFLVLLLRYPLTRHLVICPSFFFFNALPSSCVPPPTFFNVPLPLSCTPLTFQCTVANHCACPYLLHCAVAFVVHAPPFSMCRRQSSCLPLPFQCAVAFVVHAPTFSTRCRQLFCAPLPFQRAITNRRARPYLFNAPSPIVVRAPTFFNVLLPSLCTPLPFQHAIANHRARPYLLQHAVAFIVHAPTFSTRHRQSLCAPLPFQHAIANCHACPYLFNVPLPLLCVTLLFHCVIANRHTCPSSTRCPCARPYPTSRHVCAPFFIALLSCAPLPFIASCTHALPYRATVATLHWVILRALPPCAAVVNHQTRVIVRGVVVRGIVMRILHMCRRHAL
jgi:hypothetical protein